MYSQAGGMGCGGDCGCGCSGRGVAGIDIDFSSWDWHEWALLGVGVLLTGRFVFGQARRAGRAIARPIKKRGRQRRRLSKARQAYEEERRSILAA